MEKELYTVILCGEDKRTVDDILEPWLGMDGLIIYMGGGDVVYLLYLEPTDATALQLILGERVRIRTVPEHGDNLLNYIRYTVCAAREKE